MLCLCSCTQELHRQELHTGTWRCHQGKFVLHHHGAWSRAWKSSCSSFLCSLTSSLACQMCLEQCCVQGWCNLHPAPDVSSLLWLCWPAWGARCENLTGVKMLLRASGEEGLVWGWAVQPPRVVPPLLGLFLYGSEGTNKLQCFQSQEHLTLHVMSFPSAPWVSVVEGPEQGTLQGFAPALSKL